MTYAKGITITDKWYLVHNDTKALAYGQHTGSVSTPDINTCETFDTEQELIDRMDVLEYTYSTE